MRPECRFRRKWSRARGHGSSASSVAREEAQRLLGELSPEQARVLPAREDRRSRVRGDRGSAGQVRRRNEADRIPSHAQAAAGLPKPFRHEPRTCSGSRAEPRDAFAGIKLLSARRLASFCSPPMARATARRASRLRSRCFQSSAMRAEARRLRERTPRAGTVLVHRGGGETWSVSSLQRAASRPGRLRRSAQ